METVTTYIATAKTTLATMISNSKAMTTENLDNIRSGNAAESNVFKILVQMWKQV